MLQRLKTIPNRPILFALIAADLMFIFLYLLFLVPAEILPFFQEDSFSIKEDQGLAEAFQYVKELWIALIFFWLVIKRRRYALVGLALLFAYFLLDDMVEIHEKLGDLAAGLFVNFPLLSRFPNLASDDFGELFAAGLLGLFFVAIISYPYWRSTASTRQIFHTIFALLAVFLFFAIGVDFLNGFFNSPVIREMFGLVEDGGEMLAMSMICWYSGSLVGDFKSGDT